MDKKVHEADFANAAGDSFWGDVGGGVLPICRSTGRILMSLRSSRVNEPLTWGVLGGALNIDDYGKQTGKNEKVKEAVRREFIEETLYRGNLKLIPAFVFRTPTGSFTYHNYIGLVDAEFEPKRNWETERFQWMSYDEMMDVKMRHHFGLTGLLKDQMSKAIIKKWAKASVEESCLLMLQRIVEGDSAKVVMETWKGIGSIQYEKGNPQKFRVELSDKVVMKDGTKVWKYAIANAENNGDDSRYFKVYPDRVELVKAHKELAIKMPLAGNSPDDVATSMMKLLKIDDDRLQKQVRDAILKAVMAKAETLKKSKKG